MPHRLAQASLQVVAGQSLVVPLQIEGLPEQIEALGESWQRKIEFHLTAISARKLEREGGIRPDLWELITRVAAGCTLGPISALDEVRRVWTPEKPGLRTLIVMVGAPGLDGFHRELSHALGARFEPPPAHVTLYSNDPTQGIGIDDVKELRERAPQLLPDQQDEVRRAMRFHEAFPDDGGIPYGGDASEVLLGATDPIFTPRAMKALAYAAHVHRDQLRKGTKVPYLAHLISVAALVAEEGGTETEVMGALLHDAAEDHGGEERLRDVGARFGGEVQEIVRALSDSLVAEGEPKEPWRPRKERYLAHLREERRPAVLRVSNADKLHNVRAILADHRQLGDAVWNRFEAPRGEQLWYYRELAKIFLERRRGMPLAGEFAAAVQEAARLAAY